MASILNKAVAGLAGGSANGRLATQTLAQDASSAVQRRGMAGRDGVRFTTGLIYRTGLSTRRVEEWLEQSATGKWIVALVGLDEDMELKTLKILFEHESDKQSFVRKFAGA